MRAGRCEASPDNAPMARRRQVALLLGLLALCAGEVARAQFATSVQAVEVYATVTRTDELAVPDLVASDFEILEDGVRQTVSVFAAGEFPLTVALGVDRSLSMRGEPLRLAIRASQAFLRALRPPDRSMVWAIADGAEVIAPIDSPRESQVAAIAALFPWSTTALHDGVVAALDRLDPEPGRQAVVLFTDGADRYSTATAAAVLDRAQAQPGAGLHRRGGQDAAAAAGRPGVGLGRALYPGTGHGGAGRRLDGAWRASCAGNT